MTRRDSRGFVVGMPEKPDFLGDIASREWDELGPALVEAGILTPIDRGLFAALCTLHQRGVTLRGAMATANGQERQLLAGIERHSAKTWKGLLQQFGLTPRKRSDILASRLRQRLRLVGTCGTPSP